MTTADRFHAILSSVKLLSAAIVQQMSPGMDEITQRQAYDEYGRPWVEKNTKRGLLRPRRKGAAKNSPLMYSRTELLALISAEREAVDNFINQ
jgi:hypothetical protein